MGSEMCIRDRYVTHDQVEAMTLADRVVVMNHGLVQQVGTPTEIYNSPLNTFVAGFIGSPAMNLLEGSISNGCFEAEKTKISGLKIQDGPVTLGFRAEDAEISKRKSEISSTVYAMELLGDATMVTVKIKDKLSLSFILTVTTVSYTHLTLPTILLV